MKYRIVKHNKLNWAIQEWQPEGEAISRGPHAGKATKGLWKVPKAFYPSLKRAALDLLDIAAGDALLTGEATSILDAIKLAEQRVQVTLASHPLPEDASGPPDRTDSPCDDTCTRNLHPMAECDCSRVQ